MASHELIQSTVEIIDSAHSYRLQLSQLLDTLAQLEDQVCISGSHTMTTLKTHFQGLKTAMCETLDARLNHLMTEVERVRDTALKPLHDCRILIEKSVETAAQVMEEGGAILANDPENNMERILKFKDNPLTKCLASFPELPSPVDVAHITVELTPNLKEELINIVKQEGKISSRAPVQIINTEEKPGGIQIHWAESEEDSDLTDFMLQYACGQMENQSDTRLLYHTVFEGPATTFTLKNLRTNTPYSFRVCGRTDKSARWSPWSLTHVAKTTIPHHQWGPPGESYSLSNEGRTATRMGDSLTKVLYSATNSYIPGDIILLRILDSADVSPGDGLAIICDKDNEDTCNRPGAIFVDTYGTVFVDGQEMKTKLPPIKKGTILTFQTETQPNGKVRVSVQVDDKEVTLDWKVPSCDCIGLGFMQPPSPSFYFALRFAQENWKIGVE